MEYNLTQLVCPCNLVGSVPIFNLLSLVNEDLDGDGFR